jgi:hypothetical protein
MLRLSKADKLNALIKKQTIFSVKGLSLHQKLIAAAPEKNKAYFEAFLFNNWVSYHLIAREICASFPEVDAKAIHDNVAQMLIISAQNKGVPDFEKLLFVKISDYCDNDFKGYAEQSFWAYDSSVSRHQSPAWYSAAIRLDVCADIPFPDAEHPDFDRKMEDMQEVQNEAAQIFIGLEERIREDVQDYVRTK